MVISDFIKTTSHAGRHFDFYFWKDKTGHEVDCLIPTKNIPYPVEIKSGQTVSERYFEGIEFWRKLKSEHKNHPAWVIYGGNEKIKHHDIWVTPWFELGEKLSIW